VAKTFIAKTNDMRLGPFLKGVAWGLVLAVIGLAIGFYVPDRPLDSLKESYTYPDSEFIAVDGMEVHYRRTGTGPVLLLLHGTGASLHTWEGWTQELSDSCTVISLDLPAFGLTGPHPERDYSIASYVDFLEAFAKKLPLDTFHLAGNSLGGLIAWSYATAHPERVERLILVDPSGMPNDNPTPLGITLAETPVIGQLLRFITPKPLFAKSLREVYGDPEAVSDEVVDRYFQLFRRPGNRQAFIDRARSDHRVPAESLTNITAPTLILWGEKDTWIPVEHAPLFQELIPESEVITYPNLGHVPMEEAPELTAKDVRAYLEGARSSGSGQ